MKTRDPSLQRRDLSGYLRRYRPFKGYHLSTCYP